MANATKSASIVPNPALEPANHFELRRGRKRITYTATNFAGQRQLDYDDGTESRSFTGDAVRSEESALGTLLTVELKVIFDGPKDLLTLVLPEVLLEGGKPEKLSAPVIFHTVQGSIVGRPLNPGPVQTYEEKTFRGTADFVLT